MQPRHIAKLRANSIVTYFSIFIRAPKIICVSERTSFPGSSRTPILRRSQTSEQSVDVWTSWRMQHEEPRVANLTILRREEESSTVTFDYVEILLIILLLLITMPNECFSKTTTSTKKLRMSPTTKRPTKRLLRHYPLLKHLSKLSEPQKKNFIKTADKSLVQSICECCINILNRQVPLNASQKARLKRNKRNLRNLILSKTAIGKKCKILQKGVFWSAILSAALPIVGSLIAGAIGGSRRR